MQLIRIMRPSHWIKNVFVFAALIFGKKLFGPADETLLAVGSTVAAFFCFCLAASAIYIFNDMVDREADSIHPERRSRPIAAGRVSIVSAVLLSSLLAVGSTACSFIVTGKLGIIILIYIVLMILYSLLLKRVMILDCVTISVGFCLRAVAGAVVVAVDVSPWLIICTFALCLFLAFSKRRGEVAQLQENSEAFRKTLSGYTPELLAHMLDVTSVLAVVCFLLYSMDDRTFATFGTNNLVYTTPLVLYCVFRFSALTQKGVYSDPVKLIFRDWPFQLGFVLWVILCVAIIYGNKLGISLSNIWAD